MNSLSFWFTDPSVCFYVYGVLVTITGLIILAICRKIHNNKIIEQSPLLQAAIDLNDSYKASLSSVSLKYTIADKNVIINRRISVQEFDVCFNEWLRNRRNNERITNWMKSHISNLGKHKKYMQNYIALSEKSYDMGDKADDEKFAKQEAKLYKKLCLKQPKPCVEYSVYVVGKQSGKTLQMHRYQFEDFCYKFFNIDVSDIQLRDK